MKIAYVPGYSTEYSRTRIIYQGLKIKHQDVRLYGSSSRFSIVRFFHAIFKYLLRKKRDEDAVIIGFLGQPLLITLKPFIKKKIVLDAFFSLYDTLTADRKKIQAESILGKFLFWLDKRACSLADNVIVDTYEHASYFSKTFNVPQEKLKRVLVGSDNNLFYPQKNPKGKRFVAGFYGWFIPLQGAEYIVRAAKLLEDKDVDFKLVGSGQDYSKCVKLSNELRVKNIEFVGVLDYEKLPEFIKGLDVGLGIFGDSEKTARVIPNKAYDVIAMKKPLITADTPAIREIFQDRGNALLCEAASPEAIAKAILELKKNKKLRDKIADNGYKLYKESCTPERIGEQLLNVLS